MMRRMLYDFSGFLLVSYDVFVYFGLYYLPSMKTNKMRSMIGCVVACLLATASAFSQEDGRVSLGIVLHPVQKIDVRHDTGTTFPSDTLLVGVHSNDQVVAWVSSFSAAEAQTYGLDSVSGSRRPALRSEGGAMIKEGGIPPSPRESTRPLPPGWLIISNEWHDGTGQHFFRESDPALGAVYLYSVLAR